MQDSKLIIGISSRALFDLDESHEIYKKHGLKSYEEYQIDNEDKTLKPGQAFSLVNKILNINELYDGDDRVEVILLSRNTSDTGLRIRNSIEDHKLNISSLEMAGKNPNYINFKFKLIIRNLKNFTNFIAELKQKSIKFKIIRHEEKRNAFTQKILKYFKKN